jgi:hypothetical protein
VRSTGQALPATGSSWSGTRGSWCQVCELVVHQFKALMPALIEAAAAGVNDVQLYQYVKVVAGEQTTAAVKQGEASWTPPSYDGCRACLNNWNVTWHQLQQGSTITNCCWTSLVAWENFAYMMQYRCDTYAGQDRLATRPAALLLVPSTIHARRLT